MSPDRRFPIVLVWLAVTVIVAVVVLLVFRSLTRVPDLAGRTAPEDLFDDPALVLEDPGILGSAVEVRVTTAVRACMEARGFDYPGPAVAGGLDTMLDPARDGYGIAAGSSPEIRIGSGSIPEGRRPEYETALFGGDLSGDPGSGGCAAVGLAELNAAVAELDALPYPIAQLQAEVAADSRYRDALAEWVSCMRDEGITAISPDKLIEDFVARLSRSSAEEARELAEEERRVAAADFGCRRRTIDRALTQIAPEYGERFVAENREQLEALIPRPEASEVDLPPGLGSGDVQVTLLWDSTDDFDLAVSDPAGDLIYYGVKTSPSGGRLDVDANAGCGSFDEPVENVFWPRGAAPGGTYTVIVTYLGDCDSGGPESYELIVQVNGSVVIHDRTTVPWGETREYTFRFGS